MTAYWKGAVILVMGVLMCMLAGCSSGGDAPKPMTNDQLYTRALGQLESVTTNPLMDPDDARTTLRGAVRDYGVLLQAEDTYTVRAKMGYACANMLLGFYDLTDVMPRKLDELVYGVITNPGGKALNLGGATDVTGAIYRTQRSRASDAQNTQIRIASRTLPTLRDSLALFDDVETAVRGGEDIRLRLYKGGKIVTVQFDVADIQLVSACANGITALLHLSIAFNLDMPEGTAVRPVPIDVNSNGMFDPVEYLIAKPFLEKFYTQGMSGFLQYVRYTGTKLQEGAALGGHTSGTNALIDTSDPEVRQTLDRIATYGAALTVASTTTVTTNSLFDDGIARTIDMSRLLQINSLRELLPAFQANNLSAQGVWPDPTFQGVFTPGIPQGAITVYYSDIDQAY